MANRLLIIAAVMTLASSVAAEPPPAPAIKGTFAFDQLRPKARCRKVEGKLLREIERLLCLPPDRDVGTASGKPLVARCFTRRGAAVEPKPKKGNDYVLFATKADCEEERATQLANE